MARLLLIVGGGIAAFKSLELTRLARAAGHSVAPVLTASAKHFVTPMSLAALAESPVHETLWDLTQEAQMGHIALSRAADLLVVCPATADLLARMATGQADDLATTLLLATDKPVLAAPAMNVRMWLHSATQANVATLRARGVTILDPDVGPMACGEHGPGRLPEPAAILQAIEAALHPARPLAGRHVLVTAGPTREPIDPVRYLSNHSSGRQGFAIAESLASLGARVTLVAGPVALPTPAGVHRIDVETALQMHAAAHAALPADAAVMVAAVADFRVEPAAHKAAKSELQTLHLMPNPDILASLAASPHRPRLLVGFAAETRDVNASAAAKRARKGADWIVANDVSGPPGDSVMGGHENTVTLHTEAGPEDWPRMSKPAVAIRLAQRIATALDA